MNRNKETMTWNIHYVINTIGPGGIINAHTHGMNVYGHKDFQVVLNFPIWHIGYLLNEMGHRVQNGERFSPGQLIQGIYEDCPIRLETFRETGRDVLRIIIPDKNNRFPDDPLCEDRYKVQLNRAFED
ncbi:MAG: DUF4262 domain-containing protein [Eubacteriales bacterium]|nr:DUF4262 domain-containing protein [Eubacteriales bacterium]